MLQPLSQIEHHRVTTPRLGDGVVEVIGQPVQIDRRDRNARNMVTQRERFVPRSPFQRIAVESR